MTQEYHELQTHLPKVPLFYPSPAGNAYVTEA
jgi:hypothetical protein